MSVKMMGITLLKDNELLGVKKLKTTGKRHSMHSFQQRETIIPAGIALTSNPDVSLLALLGSGGAPGNALTPVIIQAEDLFHLLPSDFDCHLHDGERCNTNSRETTEVSGNPSRVHVYLHQPVWWRASNEMNTEYFSPPTPPKRSKTKINGNESSAAFCALNISRQSNLEKLSGRRKHVRVCVCVCIII